MSGNGNIGVDGKTATRRPGQPTAESLAVTSGASALRAGETNLLTKERPRICVAMTQQSGDSGRGNQSEPQEFLQLVGCRDPNARRVPWVRPRPVPAKG